MVVSEKRPLNEWLRYTGELACLGMNFESWVYVEGEIYDDRILSYLQESLLIHLKYRGALNEPI